MPHDQLLRRGNLCNERPPVCEERSRCEWDVLGGDPHCAVIIERSGRVVAGARGALRAEVPVAAEAVVRGCTWSNDLDVACASGGEAGYGCAWVVLGSS